MNSLASALATHPLARNNNPSTSHAAAATVVKFAEKHHRAILLALKATGVPMSAEQMADQIGAPMDHVKIGRRTLELELLVYIRKTDQKHVNRSGRCGFKYELTPAGSVV